MRIQAQQSLIETHRSVDLSTPIDITDDTSSTLVCILDQDINDIDNSSDIVVLVIVIVTVVSHEPIVVLVGLITIGFDFV